MGWLPVLTAFVGTLLGGGSVLFYKQNKAAKVIENESSLAKEWKKLYDEEKSKREKDSEKLDKCIVDIAKLYGKVEILEADKTILIYYSCADIGCEQRKPFENINNLKKSLS